MIPTIDVSPLLRLADASEFPLNLASDVLEAAHALDLAFSSPGGCYLESSSGPSPPSETSTAPSQIFPPSSKSNGHVGDDIYNAARALFSLPERVKLKDLPRAKGPVTRGYLPVAAESGSPELIEAKDAWAFGMEIKKPENALEGRNAWPDESKLPENLGTFRSTCLETEKTLRRLRRAVTIGLSIALTGNPGQLEDQLCGESADRIAMTRLLHYVPHRTLPTTTTNGAPKIVGSSPHTDWGFLTFVYQPDLGVPGLELLHNGEWQPVPTVDKHTVFAQCGDFLSLYSKGRWHSPVHRVVHRPDDERISVIYFAYPRFDAAIPESEQPGKERVSLLKDQSADGTGTGKASSAKAKGTFGEWMVGKWAEVQRG